MCLLRLHGTAFTRYCVYTVLRLHVFAAFRTAAHDVTPRNCTDSKDNPHDDENDMDDWHDVCIFPILLFLLRMSLLKCMLIIIIYSEAHTCFIWSYICRRNKN